jgi:hypothetical protein
MPALNKTVFDTLRVGDMVEGLPVFEWGVDCSMIEKAIVVEVTRDEDETEVYKLDIVLIKLRPSSLEYINPDSYVVMMEEGRSWSVPEGSVKRIPNDGAKIPYQGWGTANGGEYDIEELYTQ